VTDSLSPEEPSSRPMSLLTGALWSVALTMTVMVVVSLTQAARPGADADVVSLATSQLLATSVVVFAMVRWHAREVSLRATLGFRGIAPLHVALSLAAGAALCPLLSTIDDAILKRWPIDDAAAAEHLQSVISSSSRVSLVLAALVVVPVAREVFFRGVLYGGLRATTKVGPAVMATAVFFAFSTLEPQQIPTTLALGLALGWLRERSGTVLPKRREDCCITGMKSMTTARFSTHGSSRPRPRTSSRSRRTCARS